MPAPSAPSNAEAGSVAGASTRPEPQTPRHVHPVPVPVPVPAPVPLSTDVEFVAHGSSRRPASPDPDQAMHLTRHRLSQLIVTQGSPDAILDDNARARLRVDPDLLLGMGHHATSTQSESESETPPSMPQGRKRPRDEMKKAIDSLHAAAKSSRKRRRELRKKGKDIEQVASILVPGRMGTQ